MINKTSGTT